MPLAPGPLAMQISVHKVSAATNVFLEAPVQRKALELGARG